MYLEKHPYGPGISEKRLVDCICCLGVALLHKLFIASCALMHKVLSLENWESRTEKDRYAYYHRIRK